MAMKSILEVLLVVLLAGFAASLKSCTKQSHCLPLVECCSKRAFSENGEAFCVPRRKINELCLDFGMDEMMMNNTYDITCPCSVGLTCIKDRYFSPSGDLLYQRNPRCRLPSYEPPPLESYNQFNTIEGNNGNANAESFANGGGFPSAGAGSSYEYKRK